MTMDKKTRYIVEVVDNATSNVNKIGGATTKLSDTFSSLREKIANCLPTMDKLTERSFKFNQLNDMLSNLSSSLTRLSQPAATFEIAMRKANTMAGKGAEDYARLKDKIDELSASVPIARELLAEGLYQAISNGVPENNWIDYLNASARSSVGGVANLGEVVTVTSTLIKNYGLTWDKARTIQDKIQTTAKNGVTSFEQLAHALPRVSGNAAELGVEIDELMGAFATLTGVSGNTNEVATQVSALMTSLVKPTNEATKMAKALGVEFNAGSIRAAGGLAPFLSQLDEAVQRYSQRTGELKQTVYGNLFGSVEALKAITPLTGQLSDKFTDNITAMASSSGAIDEAFSQMAGTTESWAQMMTNRLAGVGDAIYGFMGRGLPVLQFTVALGQTIGGLAPAVSFLGGVISKFGVVAKVATAIQWAWNVALTANPIGVVVMAVAALIGGIVLCWNKFAGFRAFLITMWDTIKQFGSILKDFVLDRITGIINGVGKLGKAIALLFKGKFSEAWSVAKEGAKDFTGITAATKALQSAKGVVSGIGDKYATTLEQERKKDAKKEEAKSEQSGATLLPTAMTTPTMGSSGGYGVSGSISSSQGKSSSSTGSGIKQVTITIDKLVESFTINTTNLREDIRKVKQIVADTLIEAVNDVNYSM